jgi:hypothetical protein
MTEQEEFEFRRRLEEEEAANQAALSESEGPAELVNPLYATGAGALLGEVAGPAINKGAEAFSASRAARLGNAPVTTAANAPRTIQPQTILNPKGVSVEQSLDNWRTYNEAQNEAAKTIRRDAALSKKYPNLTRAPSPAAQNLAAQKAQLAAKAPTLGSQIAAKTPGVVKDLGAAGSAVMKSGVPAWLGRGIAGGSLGFEVADAYNRAKTGDTTGAIISGLGALGSGVSLLPHPLARVVGTAVGGGAAGLNVYRDRQREKEMENIVGKAAGGAIPGYNAGKRVAEGVAKMASKKPAPAAGRARQIILPVADTAPKNKFSGTQKFSEAIEPYIGTHSFHPTIVDKTILDLDVNRMGGPEAPYLQMISEPHRESGWIFANDSLPAASKLYNMGKDGNTLITGLLGSPTQLKTNRSVFNEIADEYFKAIKQGKMTPELEAKIQEKLPTLTHGKDKIQTFQDKFDIRDRDAFNEMAKGFHQRGHLADIMGGVGVTRGVPGGGKIINYEDILARNTEQSLLDAPTHSIGSRLFTVGAKPPEYRPDLHNAFDYANFGELKSGNFGYVPKEIAIPDELARIKANLVARGFDRDVTAMDIMRNSIKQPITEELWRRAQSEGFAEGGEVPGYNAGRKVVEGGLGFVKPAAKSHSQNPKVARALEDYLKGNISQAERIAIMNKELPLRPWTQMPPSYTDEQIINALTSDKQPKALIPVPAGMRVGNRLDIPAYTRHGVYVDTTHDIANKNKPISYGRTGHLKDVEFSSSPDTFVRVGLGTKPQALTPMGAEMGLEKTPKALIKGTNVGTSDEEVRRMMAEMMKDPSYAQIGMDPRRHSQFYDKSTGMPVWAAEEKLQSGPLILVPKRGLETTTWDDPRLNLSDFPGKQYAEGGLACMKEGGKTPAWQRSEGKSPSGGLNAAGRASYNRETGGNLKAPQPEGGPRKKSFCARMEGMKKKNTSSATANDPDSRINKSLRKWKC